MKKKTLRKESNILICIGIIIYLILTAINKFIIIVPNIVYIFVMIISIVIVLEALIIQKKCNKDKK